MGRISGGDGKWTYRLDDLTVDRERLQAEVAALDNLDWRLHDHYQDAPMSTDWRSVSLYSLSGRADDTRSTNRTDVKPTPVAEKCPYICKEILPMFKARWRRASLFKLAAGHTMEKHRDLGITRAMGNIRIHVPVFSNPEAKMWVNGQAYYYDDGEVWVLDSFAPHYALNHGTTDRVHLIVDFELNRELDELLAPKSPIAPLEHAGIKAVNYAHRAYSVANMMTSSSGRQRLANRLGQVFSR